MKIFLLIWVLSVMEPGGSAQELPRSGTIKLSMMDQSIDDKFYNCIKKTETRVQNEFFPREIESNPFRDVWMDCSKKTMLQRRMQINSKELTLNHTRAICVYTNVKPEVYEELNGALRTGERKYGTASFKFHALYFWLISAIQILPKSCETTYRRTPNVYEGQMDQKMRFGYFASSSLSPDQEQFGSETCFHIETCSGAYIKPYSSVPGEEEVLIPPYEVFKVKNIVSNSYQNLRDCKKIFVLESAGEHSNLNCKVANNNQQIKANLTLILAVQFWIVLLWNNPLKKSE